MHGNKPENFTWYSSLFLGPHGDPADDILNDKAFYTGAFRLGGGMPKGKSPGSGSTVVPSF